MAARRIPIRAVPRDHYVGRWREALERRAAMERELAARAHDPALLMAVQGAIAAADALTIFHRGEYSSAERHEDALEVFGRLQHLPGVREAARHLARLLRVKGEIEYTGRATTPRECKRLIDHARRFFDWVEAYLPR